MQFRQYGTSDGMLGFRILLKTKSPQINTQIIIFYWISERLRN